MFKDKNTESKYSQNRFGYISKSQKKRLYFIKRIYITFNRGLNSTLNSSDSVLFVYIKKNIQ